MASPASTTSTATPATSGHGQRRLAPVSMASAAGARSHGGLRRWAVPSPGGDAPEPPEVTADTGLHPHPVVVAVGLAAVLIVAHALGDPGEPVGRGQEHERRVLADQLLDLGVE